MQLEKGALLAVGSRPSRRERSLETLTPRRLAALGGRGPLGWWMTMQTPQGTAGVAASTTLAAVPAGKPSTPESNVHQQRSFQPQDPAMVCDFTEMMAMTRYGNPCLRSAALHAGTSEKQLQMQRLACELPRFVEAS